MNERIRLLAVEAKLIASEPNGFDPTGLTKSQQKFAQLIVRECADICMEMSAKCAGLEGEKRIPQVRDAIEAKLKEKNV